MLFCLQSHTTHAYKRPLASAQTEAQRMCPKHNPVVQVLRRSGSEREKRHAQRIEPVSGGSLSFWACMSSAMLINASMQVIARPHFLLVTLVLCNAAATEVRDAHLLHLIMFRHFKSCSCSPTRLSLECFRTKSLNRSELNSSGRLNT